MLQPLIIIAYFEKIQSKTVEWIDYHKQLGCSGVIITKDRDSISPYKDWKYYVDPDFTHMDLEGGQIARYYPGYWKLPLKKDQYLYTPNTKDWIAQLEKYIMNGISIPTYQVAEIENYAYAGKFDPNEIDLLRLSPLKTWEWPICSKRTQYKTLISAPTSGFILDFKDSYHRPHQKLYRMEEVFHDLGIEHEISISST